MENKLSVDWEIELPEQIFEYIERIFGKESLTAYQREIIKKMIKNGFIQNQKV